MRGNVVTSPSLFRRSRQQLIGAFPLNLTFSLREKELAAVGNPLDQRLDFAACATWAACRAHSSNWESSSKTSPGTSKYGIGLCF